MRVKGRPARNGWPSLLWRKKMDEDTWFNTYKDHKSVKKFIEQFGGRFIIDLDTRLLEYDDDEHNFHKTPDNGQQFLNLIEQSIEQGKNMLIQGDNG